MGEITLSGNDGSLTPETPVGRQLLNIALGIITWNAVSKPFLMLVAQVFQHPYDMAHSFNTTILVIRIHLILETNLN